MNHFYHIFCDASFHPNSGFAVGGFFLCGDQELTELAAAADPKITVELFTNDYTNNTRIEIITVLNALDYYKKNCLAEASLNQPSPIIYTDCKTVCDLLGRREKLVARNFQSKKSGHLLRSHDLYRQFFDIYDELNPTIVWVKGHSPSKDHNHIQKIFSYVDRTVRRALRSKLKLL